ncbi:MAG: hypothetical protein HXL57_03190 [Solobacterium sp.]|nr:hypothetical protein [Solobacterium sp.]
MRTELGVWQELIDSLIQIHFIIQDRDTFDSLIEMFKLPAFTPNISQQYKMINKRKHTPIMDDNSSKDYFFYLTHNKDDLSGFVNALQIRRYKNTTFMHGEYGIFISIIFNQFDRKSYERTH